MNKFLPQSKYILEFNEPASFELHYIFLGATSRHYEELFKIIDHFDDLNKPGNHIHQPLRGNEELKLMNVPSRPFIDLKQHYAKAYPKIRPGVSSR